MRTIISLIYHLMVYTAICASFIVSVGGINCRAHAAVDPKEATITQAVPTEPYVYVVEGRTDPFKPFISKKAATPAGRDPNEVVDEKTELTGMQLFEPGQLALVGVLMSGTGELALVEDQTKKGYILRLGNPIGKRGVVSQIYKHQVVITETAHTRAGKEISSTVIMRLKKEGDK
jgi:Tfp pilus assembly protein PilP